MLLEGAVKLACWWRCKGYALGRCKGACVGCCCALLQVTAITVACALWSWSAGAAAGWCFRVLLQVAAIKVVCACALDLLLSDFSQKH